MGGHLLLLQCYAFVLFLLFLTIGQTESLMVYDRQSLLSLRQNVRVLGAFNQSGQNTLPLLLAGISLYLCQVSAFLRRKHPRRRGGRLVNLNDYYFVSLQIL